MTVGMQAGKLRLHLMAIEFGRKNCALARQLTEPSARQVEDARAPRPIGSMPSV
jgi:hypothetical protein